jgi:hypothetical protein
MSLQHQANSKQNDLKIGSVRSKPSGYQRNPITSSISESVRLLVRKYPTVALSIGFTLGSFSGWLLPRSR